MTQSEFLQKLREALENELLESAVQENIEYYRSYISGEVGQGRNEQAVVEELGDPWAIAKTLIDAKEGSAQKGHTYESRQGQSGGRAQKDVGNVGASGYNLWWKRVLLILGIVGILAIVIGVIGGLFTLVMPFIVPILVIVLVFRLFGRNRH